MQRNPKKLFLPLKPTFKQRGATLILLAVIILLAGSGILFSVLDGNNVKAERDKQAAAILAEAKGALIGYTLSRVSSGERPGDMPRPDYFATSEVPSNYDGDSDGGCLDSTKANGLPLISSGTNMRCLGRLPWKALSMSVPNPSQNDTLGLMPWYAVSANLVDPICFADTDTTSGLNPGILNMTYTSYVCDSSTLLPHPWLIVRDARGNILSNRVAAVLILPGPALSGQSRPSSPLSGAASYLDTITVAASCTAPCVPGTYSNADTDNDFFMASGLTGSSIEANDRVLYITIDELIAALVKRAAGELRADLITYRAANARFPSASLLAAPLGTNNYVAVPATDSGTVPIDVTDTVSCAFTNPYMANCSVEFGLIGKVSFQRDGGSPYTWDAPTGACSVKTIALSDDTCTCTGAGSCTGSAGLSHFNCSASGNCSLDLYTGGPPGRYIYTPSAYGGLPVATGGCIISGSNVACDANGTFGIRGLLVPDWFRDNHWQDYFYYHRRMAADLQVGTHTGIQALLIGTGNPIIAAPFATSKSASAQSRPGIINDYLDSPENTDSDLVFDATIAPRSANYNDQSFIVAP